MENAKWPAAPPDITAVLPTAALAATDEIPSSTPWSSVDPGKEGDSAVIDAGEPIERQVFAPGQVFHQVEVVRFIGAGYSGEVYEARHRITGARCALKIMHLRDRKDVRKAERSLAEAHGTFGIEHANVVEVFDIGCEADGTAWMLMEFLDGPTLATVLERQGRLSPLYALHVALEVAWGLDAAHENQIIHRDVKPDNIAFTVDGSVKVVDFSIAKVIPYEMRTTQRNVRLGTAAYMAPENLAGNEADARFDVYSLGLVLWEMIAGRHPFRDAFDDRTKLVNWQFFADPAPLSEVAGLPAYVDEVIRRATAKQPAARYLSMAEMAQGMIALRRRLEQDEAEGRISLATPPGEPPIPDRPARRAVYRAPVTGPTLEVPRREPSARVVVASPAPALGSGGTAPMDLESVRAAAFGPGPWPAGREGDGRAPGSQGRTTRGTEIMEVTALSSPSGPPQGSSRPPAVRTTSPMLRQLAAEGERGSGERGEGARAGREVRMAPWMLIALVLSASLASAFATRWIAPPEGPRDAAGAATGAAGAATGAAGAATGAAGAATGAGSAATGAAAVGAEGAASVGAEGAASVGAEGAASVGAEGATSVGAEGATSVRPATPVGSARRAAPRRPAASAKPGRQGPPPFGDTPIF